MRTGTRPALERTTSVEPKPAAGAPRPSPEPEQVGLLLNRSALTLNATLDRALAPNLTCAQWTVACLLRAGHVSTASELARELGTDAAAAWRLVGRLADKDYVRRSRDPIDRRSLRLTLSPAANRAYPRWRAAVTDALDGLFAGVSGEQRAIFARALMHLIANAS